MQNLGRLLWLLSALHWSADVMFDIDLKPYDILPVLPILSGSGMKVLDLSEKSDYTTIVACKPEILSTINEIFR